MPTYECLVRDQHREYRHAPVAATSLPALLTEFRTRGLEVVRVAQRPQPQLGRVGERDLTQFFRNLAEALRSSMPLVEAIQLVGQESRHPVLQRAGRELLKDVRNGLSLSAAAAKQGGVFSETHVCLLEAGERAGRLAEAAEALAAYREDMSELTREVAAAFTYPAITLAAAAGLFLFISTFILPKFLEIFRDFRVELPLPTVLLLTFSRFVVPVILLGMFAALWGSQVIRLMLRIRPARMRFDEWLISSPWIGNLFYETTLSRLLSLLAIVARGEMPLPVMLQAAARGAGNLVVEAALLHSAHLTVCGTRLSEALEAARLFPSTVVWRIAVAERSGTVPEALAALAADYRLNAEQKLRRWQQWIEPLLLILVGGTVALVVIAAFLPLLQIITSLTIE